MELRARINLRKSENGDEYFKLVSLTQLGSSTIALSVNIVDIAHRLPLEDTIYQVAEDTLDVDYMTFYPLQETLRDVLEDEGYEILDEDFNPNVVALNGSEVQLSEI